MYELENALTVFAFDTENDEKNYDLAIIYDKLGQTAAAISYYLRTADRTDNKELAYECLIRAGHCFNKQGNRDLTVEGLYKRAMDLIPTRPEAYYVLSRFFEWKKNYRDSYNYCCLALNNANFYCKPLRSNVHENVIYTDYGILFQKAVAAWWIGRGHESRSIFKYLAKEYNRTIDKQHLDSIQDNLSRLGVGPMSQSKVPFEIGMLESLRYKFKGYELVNKNYSQVMQDIFILSALDGKKNGTYLEIGSASPFLNNNTALLETEFGWTGVGIEYKQEFVNEYSSQRKNKILCTNALDVNYTELLNSIAVNGCVDYLQLDCEPSSVTYEIMTKIPFDKFKFAVITYEHDDYVDVYRKYRDKSRAFLLSRGYVLLVSNVSPDGISNFEDWWVHPDLVSQNIINILKCDGNNTKSVKEYFTSSACDNDHIKLNLQLDYRSRKRLIVEEGFYNEPISVRSFALSQHYNNDKFTINQFLFPGIKERFENLLGVKISQWDDSPNNGKFQLAKVGDPAVYRCGDFKWTGIIFLSPNAPFETGITLWAHKKTGIHHSSHPEIGATFAGSPIFDKTLYEPVDKVGNVFNRLVIFDSGCINSISEYFGFDDDTCGLWHTFFFN